ncbi:MAG: hypothetical protein KJN69_15230 [Gammaproteobacteria bacterium]|nr:hypothetical protein [Gammaproteobacteria bacterium]
MKNKMMMFVLGSIFLAGFTAAGAGEPAEAVHEEKIVIALSTDDFDLPETDISHLGIGDAETIHTESGKTIDLLRTEEGVEIYLDGERLDMGTEGDEGLHGEHAVMHKRVEVVCETEDDCEETVWMSGDEEIDVESLHGEGQHRKVIVIKEKVETN